MTGPGHLAQADLSQCFDLFTSSAFRLETLRTYAVPEEDARLAAFRQGLPRPERSTRTSPWLKRIAETTAAGKSWRRVRVLSHPLSEYEQYQMLGYRESNAAGDVILIADRTAYPELDALTRDLWLFDSDTPKPFAALMNYDPAGRYLGAEISESTAVIDRCRAERELAERYAVTLSAYLAYLDEMDSESP